MKFNGKSNLIRQFLKKRKLQTFVIILVGIISNILTILIPVSIGKYYQLVFHMHAKRVKSLQFIPEKYWDTVPEFLTIFTLLILFRYFFFFIYEYSLRKEAAIFIKEIKDYLFRHQLHIKYNIYKEKGIGKYLLRYSGDINSIKNLYIKGTIRVFIDIIMIIIALFWLYQLNPKGSLVIIILSLIFYLILRIINKKVEHFSIQKRNKTSGQLSFVSRSLNSILNTITLNKQYIELKKYKKKSNAIKDVSIKYNKWFVINKGFISFIQYIILSVILYVFYIDSLNNENNGGNLISFILLYLTILPVIRRLFTLETVYKLGNISVRKLKNILELEEEKTNSGKKIRSKILSIYINHLKFNRATPIDFKVENLKLNELLLPKGVESLDIILAFLRIQENYSGKIEINNKNIKIYAPFTLRENIAVSSKNIPLSGRSVYEAITTFRSKKTKASISKSYNMVLALFEKNIHLKLDDYIGENGSKLSKIEKEFLYLVRGIIQNKQILIIEEFPLLETINKKEIKLLLEGLNTTTIKIKHSK